MLLNLKALIKYSLNIDITFGIDANGLIKVSAKDINTEKEFFRNQICRFHSIYGYLRCFCEARNIRIDIGIQITEIGVIH